MVAAAAIGAAVIGAGSSMLSSSSQAGSEKNAAQAQMKMYNQTRSDLLPYMTGGNNAFSAFQNLMGLNGGNPQSQLTALQNTPGYQFAFGQGEQALDRSAAARGMLLSGGQLKDVTGYGQGMASQLYQQTLGNYMNAASLGENAAAQTGNAGTAAAGQAGGFMQNAGTATASGYAGAANNIGSLLNNSAFLYQLQNGSGGGMQAGADPSLMGIPGLFSGTGVYG